MQKSRSLSATEKGMIITIVLLGIFVLLRWGYISKRAADGMNYLKPDSTAIQKFKNSKIENTEDFCD